MTMINYQRLLDRFIAGDDEAFRTLYLGLYPRLVVAARQAGDYAEVAEEVIQDLFFWVWNNRERLSDIDSLEEYLYRSTYRNMQRALRREQAWRQRGRAAEEAARAEPEGQHAILGFIDREAEQAQHAILTQILATLSPGRGRSFIYGSWRRRATGRSVSLLSISEQVLRNLTYRAIKKLRRASKRSWLPLVLLAVGWSVFRVTPV